LVFGTDNIRFASGFWCLIVSNDPEKTFAEAADHIIHQANNYSAWLSAAGLSPLSGYLRDRQQLRQSGLLQVVDAETAVGMIREFINNVPITHCRFICAAVLVQMKGLAFWFQWSRKQTAAQIKRSIHNAQLTSET
jgi:hypothetical protein